MPERKRYVSDESQTVDGVYIEARLPFWTASAPKPDWVEFEDHEHSSAMPVPRDEG